MDRNFFGILERSELVAWLSAFSFAPRGIAPLVLYSNSYVMSLAARSCKLSFNMKQEMKKNLNLKGGKKDVTFFADRELRLYLWSHGTNLCCAFV